VEEATLTGMFNLFTINKNKPGFVPVLCVDEAYSFFKKLLNSTAKNDTSMSMERLCKLYDGDHWLSLKGSQGKRVGVMSAYLSFVSFTTPMLFLKEVWPKILTTENGFSDRMLIMFAKRCVVPLDHMEATTLQLTNFNVRNLKSVYESVYNEHHPVQKVYTLSEGAKEVFYAYDSKLKLESESDSKANAAKLTKHALKLSLVLHVLWHRIGQALDIQSNPTPEEISEETMNRAIHLNEHFITIAGILKESLQKDSAMKSGVNGDDIKRKVLLGLPGPFLSSKRVYNSFSSSQRPTPSQTEVAMRELEQDGFGTVQHIGRSMVFYKTLPSEISPAALLNQYGTNMETYTDNFFARDSLMSSSQFDTTLVHHHQFMEVENAMLEYELEQYYIASQTGPYAVNAAAADTTNGTGNEGSISEHEEEEHESSEVVANHETDEENNESEHDSNEASGSSTNRGQEVESQVVPNDRINRQDNQGEESSESTF